MAWRSWIGLEDPGVGEAVVDRAAVTTGSDEPGRAEHREVLAHVRHLAADPDGELAHGELAVREGLEDAQALGIAEGSTDGG